ncbi:hypothetical protein NW762_004453 [Fusarium torreyae]|uniref:Uncharacterized protein n=1 Tax=Fusarium torreyae TaxID=1237075 RepID=A0A9W8S8Y3_9HYPO|nr:hypothetical protein NW762_004453 [Fusarium torreyae]
MDARGLDGKESITSHGNINLNDHQLWINPNPSTWQLQEQERERLRGSNIGVQQWLQEQPNSQPSQDTFINSQSLYIRKRRTYDVIDHVDDVFGAKSKPSSVQTTGSSTTTTLHTLSPPLFNTALPVNEPLQRSRPALPPSEPPATTSDRKIRYHDNGNHDEGRPPDISTSQGWSTISATSSGPQTRGAHKGSSVPPRQQTRWPSTGTDASSASKKLPKRQNSRSTDDETTGKHPFPKRYRSGHSSHSLHRTSPPSSGSAKSALPATSVSLEASVSTTQGLQRRTRDISSSSSSSGSGSSSAQRDEAAQSLVLRQVSHEHFKNVSETCFFWLFDPEQFSSSERGACCGRKDEISHIITHAVDHHGLIRGKDPRNPSPGLPRICRRADRIIDQHQPNTTVPIQNSKPMAGQIVNLLKDKHTKVFVRLTPGNPFLWQQTNNQQQAPEPIGYVPVYATPQPGVVSVSPMMQRNGNQETFQSFCPPMVGTPSFGYMQSNTPEYVFRQQQTQFQTQNVLFPPGQYQRPQQPLRQAHHSSHQPPPRTIGQTQQQFRRNASPTELPQDGLPGLGFSQQSFYHFSAPNPAYPALSEGQQQPHVQPLSTGTDSTGYTDQGPDLYQASFDAVSAPQPQDQITTPINDLDATISLSGIQSLPPRLQSSPSLVPSTTGEPVGFLHSPNVEEPRWLQGLSELGEETDDVGMDLSLLDYNYIGLNPELQTTFETADPPPRQPQDRLEDLAPESQIPAEQQASLEKDSGYYSGDVNNMFM